MSVVESSKDIELYLRQDSHTISYRKCTEDHCHVVELGSGRLTFAWPSVSLSCDSPHLSSLLLWPLLSHTACSSPASGGSTRCSASRRGGRGRTCGRESRRTNGRLGLVLHGEFWPNACDGPGVCMDPLSFPNRQHVTFRDRRD